MMRTLTGRRHSVTSKVYSLYQKGGDPINYLSQIKQSHMQMELTYREAGKPLPKAYDGDEGLISFTLAHME